MDKTIDTCDIRIYKEPDVAKYLPRIRCRVENEDFYEEVAENSGEVFTVAYGDEVIGLVYMDDDTEGFLYVFIFPEHRRRGYGFAAARAAEGLLKTPPPKSILTGYPADDEAARRLAGKLGYGKKFSSAVMQYRGEMFDDPAMPVRKYRDEDFPEAFALSAGAFHRMRLETGCFPDSVLSQPDEEARANWAETADERYVYVLGNEIVGHAQISGDVLDSVSIGISHQGKGLGRVFVRYLVNRLLEAGSKCPHLWCVVGNDKARSLYESLGFEETGRAEYAEKKIRTDERSHTMKFSEMPYNRPDPEEVKNGLKDLTERLKAAKSYEEARAVFLEKEEEAKLVNTMWCLASVRHSIDTRDEFYDAENDFWDDFGPELEEYLQEWIDAMLVSPFRRDFEAEYGDLLFVNAEIAKKTFSPEIIEDMQRENELTTEYAKLIASAQIPFEEGVYTLSQMEPFQTDPDDGRRLAAWKAKGQWYKDNQPQLDRIYDDLTHLRDTMGRKLGYGGYTQLGYYRMERNCYTKDDVEKFRTAVQKYLVPVADRILREQARRLGKEYPLSFADNALSFRSGNPRPVGTAEDILEQGQVFYDALSPETSEFFRTMRGNGLMDVLSTEGKEGGGYCTDFELYQVPFIFANFNGTQGDVEVVTHEAGHAFAYWMNRDRIPTEYIDPTLEACEVHSMSMEFFGWRNAEGFFGPDARKFLYSHLAGALTFIPYGTMVDHFQHIVYEKPELTPADRHAEWKRLLGIYQPWLKLDGEIPFFSDGEGWQRQSHIYECPFYYIDYCLAQTVSLEFWAMIQKDPADAWRHYMAYTKQGGSRTFTELLRNAGLKSPFDEECLKEVCETATKWLESFDLTGIE